LQRPPTSILPSPRSSKLGAKLRAVVRHPFSAKQRRAYREHLRSMPLPGVARPALIDAPLPNGPWQLGLKQDDAPPPLVSIIIPVHNQLDFTYRCLMSIVAHPSQANIEIIVCDDASDDSTATVLRGVGGIRYISNTTNRGFLHSCNRASEEACGQYLLFLNNDTQVQEGWLDHMLALFEADMQTGLVGAKLLFPNGRLQEAGGVIWRDASAYNYGRYDDPAKPEYNYVREVDYCSGACILIKTDLFRQLGGFDDLYAPAYYEDTDLAFRVRQAGRKVLYQPRAVVVHHEGVSHGTDTRHGMKAYQIVNQAKFRERWRSELEELHFPKPS
jgi:O-antigen biosynthesis protein